MQHAFMESANPRLAGKCACGRPEHEHPRTEGVLWRNVGLERQIVREATRGLCDGTALIDHAQMRMMHLSGEYVDDPMQIRPGMDRPREMREEIVDFVSHALLHAQEHPDDMELLHDVQIAIRAAAVLYNRTLPED